MSDFVNEELVEIDVFGRKFKFKEMLGPERDEMEMQSWWLDEKKMIRTDLVKKNNYYLKTVKEAPYPEWKGLKEDQRVPFLNKLKNKIRGELLNQLKKHHNTLSETEKK